MVNIRSMDSTVYLQGLIACMTLTTDAFGSPKPTLINVETMASAHYSVKYEC